ncbi:hypothetical protein NGB36_25370 [Streptomyces sp. RB6PN25]|uniref:Secreted protein n=1 Tax=Streptomyces humicola TaxID=2953240 RepID=A0ABT1Q1M2_9ACTN|nr:hypothetical protein [Streptomyces humicola]MCQ4083831.1 hypothetical protein [Streptomyces humicola]
MPRPTPAQFAYGSATVVFSTLAMLLLFQATSGAGVIAIALAGLALGVLVAVTVALPWSSRAATAAALPAPGAPKPPLPGLPRTRTGGSAEPALSEHSLRP